MKDLLLTRITFTRAHLVMIVTYDLTIAAMFENQTKTPKAKIKVTNNLLKRTATQEENGSSPLI
jgi:hypothetical protein